MVIYKFTHIETGRSYIGQTIQSANQRRLEHIADSRGSPATYHFHNALKKYGIDAFTFEVLREASTIEELNRLELFYVNEYDSINNGFNIRTPGDNRTHHPDSIERMSVAQVAAHARRRAEGREGGWTRKDGGGMKGKVHPRKGTSGLWNWSESSKEKIRQQKLEATYCRGRTWKMVNGKRVWMDKE